MPIEKKYAELAAQSTFACTLLGSFATWDCIALRIPFRPDDLGEQIARRQLRFLGVAAIVDGIARTALVPEMASAPPQMIEILSLAFLEQVEIWAVGDVPTLPATPGADDSIGFCERLYALPDLRG